MRKAVALTILIVASAADAQTSPPPKAFPDPHALTAAASKLQTALDGRALASATLRSTSLGLDKNVLALLGPIKTSDAEVLVSATEAAISSLHQMQEGCNVVLLAEQSLDLEQLAQLATNPWSEVSIRNTFDEVQQWGTVLGSLASAVGFSMSSESDRKTAVVSGLGLVAVSQLLGRVFGKATGNKASEVTGFLALTVRAYDDVKARNGRLSASIVADRSLSERVAAVLRDQGTPTTDEQRAKLITTVLNLLPEYTDSLKHFTSAVADIEAVYGQYVISTTEAAASMPESKVFAKLQERVKEVAQRAATLKAFYNETVLTQIRVNRELEARLIAAAH